MIDGSGTELTEKPCWATEGLHDQFLLGDKVVNVCNNLMEGLCWFYFLHLSCFLLCFLIKAIIKRTSQLLTIITQS